MTPTSEQNALTFKFEYFLFVAYLEITATFDRYSSYHRSDIQIFLPIPRLSYPSFIETLASVSFRGYSSSFLPPLPPRLTHRDLVEVGLGVKDSCPDDHMPVFATGDKVVLVVRGRSYPRHGLGRPAKVTAARARGSRDGRVSDRETSAHEEVKTKQKTTDGCKICTSCGTGWRVCAEATAARVSRVTNAPGVSS